MYADRRFKRAREPLYLNDNEAEAGMLAAKLLGMEWGVLKREIINGGVQRILRERGVQVTEPAYEL